VVDLEFEIIKWIIDYVDDIPEALLHF